MNQGLIAGKEDTDAARSKADLTPYKEEIRAMATKTPQEFSTELRKLLP